MSLKLFILSLVIHLYTQTGVLLSYIHQFQDKNLCFIFWLTVG